MDNGASWLANWFSEIRRLELGVIDKERVTWVRAFGFPCHLWNEVFFKFLATSLGLFISANDITASQSRMDVARFFIRTS